MKISLSYGHDSNAPLIEKIKEYLSKDAEGNTRAEQPSDIKPQIRNYALNSMCTPRNITPARESLLQIAAFSQFSGCCGMLKEFGLEKSEYAVTPFKLNEMPKINEISHFAHIDYQAFAINDCAACF